MKSKRLIAGIGVAGILTSFSTFGYLLGNNQTVPIRDKSPTVLPLPQTPVRAAEPPPAQIAPSRPYISPPELEVEECPITTCNDGTCSSSTGRGTCSWHGGVAY